MELKTVRGNVDFVRSDPKRYFVSGSPSALELLRRVVGEAYVCGASWVDTAALDGWWLISADVDWLESPDGRSISSRFDRIEPFPQAGANSMRSGILVSAFARGVVTQDSLSQALTIVPTESKDELLPLLEQIRKGWRRWLAFEMD